MKDITVPKEQRERKPKSQRRGMVRFRLAYILLLGVMGLFAYAYLQKTQEVRSLSAQQAALMAENQRVAQDNAITRRENRYYRTQQYEIQDARSMGWTGPGETSIQVLPVKHPVAVVRRAIAPLIAPAKPAWQQWWNSFFD